MSGMRQPPDVSVLTLVRNRQAHLDALVAALREQTHRSFELVVASMQPQQPAINDDLPFEVSRVHAAGDALPLAAARNAAATGARAPALIFLDVDCVPSPTLVATYAAHLARFDHCAMGEVRYLPQLADARTLPFDALAQLAQRHPGRPPAPAQGWRVEPEARRLWGLSFALRKARYFAAGGMDESFVGYGAEETDFAESLRYAGTQFVWCADALALHQHHTVFSPPLDKFDDIVANASRFHAKRGSWCMEHWLGIFAERGYLDWRPQCERMTVLRRPATAEISATRQRGDVTFA